MAWGWETRMCAGLMTVNAFGTPAFSAPLHPACQGQVCIIHIKGYEVFPVTHFNHSTYGVNSARRGHCCLLPPSLTSLQSIVSFTHTLQEFPLACCTRFQCFVHFFKVFGHVPTTICDSIVPDKVANILDPTWPDVSDPF